MRWIWLVAVLAIVGVATVWSGDGDQQAVIGAQATTTSAVVETIPRPEPSPIPFADLQPPPLPPGLPAAPPGGGFACLPTEADGTTTATFRWVHVYESSGRFNLRVTARAGTCAQPAATGGLSGVIDVT